MTSFPSGRPPRTAESLSVSAELTSRICDIIPLPEENVELAKPKMPMKMKMSKEEMADMKGMHKEVPKKKGK
jgi:hypothetical protein